MRTKEELGLELQNYRLEKDIKIDYLIEQMKVSKNIIIQIEEGTVQGENSRARLLYKKYIEKIGLNYSEYEEEIKELFPSIVEETINLSSEDILEEIKVKKKFKLNKGIISLCIVILFLVVLIYFTAYNFNNQVAVDEFVNETTTLPSTVLEPQYFTQEPLPEVQVSKISTNQVVVALDSLTGVKVKIVPDANTGVYYSYSDNSVVKEEKTITTETVIDIQDATNATLNIGLLSGTKLYVNDVEITEKIEGDVGSQNYITFKLQDQEG